MIVFETERIVVRNWKTEDANEMYDYAKNENVGPNAGWAPHESVDESKNIIKMFIRDGDSYAMVHKKDNKVIGSLGIHESKPDVDNQKGNQKEIGYVLHPDYWGQGIVTEVVEEAIKYCINDIKVDIIWCGHYDFNQRSKRVVEKSGFDYKFTKEMTLAALNDKKVNMLFYSIENI
jgi:RimJ/RimL family protein N-acetyltransferase